MAKKSKKGESGAATNFITRTKAVRKLQVSLADFRRLCILKGIYPREPRNKKKILKGSSAPKTFYWVKDIAFLAHEPLLRKFREFKAFTKKIRRAVGKGQTSVANSLKENKPVYTLDHIVKERYPTFIDAIRDLDDALCMLALFARMPSVNKVTEEVVRECSRLMSEFLHYVILTNSLRKVFLSIKGIYYQADIHGQPITWIAPYPFRQHIPSDVDFRVMMTFLEFYQTLVGFVNFKLYQEEHMYYPPALDTGKDAGGAGLSAYTLQRQNEQVTLAESLSKAMPSTSGPVNTAQIKESAKRLQSLESKLATIANGSQAEAEDESTNANANEMELDEFPANEQTDMDTENPKEDIDANTYKQLFAGCNIFMSREVPRESIEFVVRACGGKVGWADGEGSPYQENDEHITHHVVDRPVQGHVFLARDYIQPQWIYDCINARRLLPTTPYAPGKALPPHLSPFVVAQDGDYDPLKEHNIHGQVAALGEEEEEAEEEEAGETAADEEEGEKDEEEDEDEEDEEEEEKELDSEEEEAALHAKELEAEAAGMSYSEFMKAQQKANANTKKRTKEEREAEEERELAKMMMSKKDRRLYNQIQFTKEKKAKEVAMLQKKRQQLEKSSKRAKTQ